MMKKILLALSLVFGLATLMHAAVEGSDVDVTGYDDNIHITAKSSIGLNAGETIKVPLKKLATVTRYVPYERDLYFRAESNGFTVTFMIPAKWNGKSNVEAVISLDTDIKFGSRKFRSRSNDWVFYVDSSYSNASRYMRIDDVYFDLYEKIDRAVLSFAKSEIIVKEPAAGTVMDGIGKLKIKGKLARDVQVEIESDYNGDKGVEKKIWIDSADSVVTLPAGAKTAEFKFKYMGDSIVNIKDYAEVEFGLKYADRDVISYESDDCKVTIKDAQKAEITGSFGKPTGTEVAYLKPQSFDLVIEGNLPEPGGDLGIYDQNFYITLGGTAVYDEDYELIVNPGKGSVDDDFDGKKTLKVNFWGGTKTCKVTVKYLHTAAAKKDRTITLKLSKVEMYYNESVKCKIAKGSVANFVLKAPLPAVVGVCRYGSADSLVTLSIPNFISASVSSMSKTGETDSTVTLNYKWAAMGSSYGFRVEDDHKYSAWLDAAKTDSSSAPVRLYGGHPVCQGVEFEVSIDSAGAFFEKAPVIKANVFDPVKDPTEAGKAKKIAAKAVTKLSKTAPVSTFVVSVNTTPTLYDKKALKAAYNEGKYFADVAKEIQKAGAGMDMTLTWKQGKTGSENQSYDNNIGEPQYKDVWVGTVIAVGPEFSATTPLTIGGAATDSVVSADTEVVVTGKFFTAKPKAFLEYKVDGKIKTLNLKTLVASMDSDGNSTLTVAMPNQAKIDALGDSDIYLVIDSGSALAARKVGKK